MADEKNAMVKLSPATHDESPIKGQEDLLHAMPSILAGLDESECRRIGRKALLKMDIVIMPTLMVMYILNFLDRNNIASARLAGLEEDLNLTRTEYQTCVSILFVGYSK